MIVDVAGLLTPRELRFCEEYVIDGKAQKAAIRAGIPKTGAHVTASRLLKRAKVQEKIAELRAKMGEECEVKAQRWARELARVAFSDLRKGVTDTGSVKPPCEWSDEFAAAVASYEWGPDGVKIKLWDKNAALKNLGVHLGLMTEKVAVESKSLEDLLAAAYERVLKDEGGK